MKNICRPTNTSRRPFATSLMASAAVAVACLAAPLPASAQLTVLAPPAARYEAAPPPRVGYAWQRGYWAWQRSRYVWTQGQWVNAPRGRPVPPPPAVVSNVVRLSADALFPFDADESADILPGGRSQIRSIAADLRATPFGSIEVRGYTDRLGTTAYNQRLSQRRADAVKMLLIREGVPADRIVARGFGEQDSLTRCSDNQPRNRLVSCLQPDRRVEIVTFARSADRPMQAPIAQGPAFRR